MATATKTRTTKPANAAACEGMVFGVFTSKADAEGCFDALLAKGFPSADINVMMSDATRDRYFAGTPSAKGGKAGTLATEGMGVGGAIGTAVGATIAAVAAVGTSLALPGLGIVVAGPIAAALAGGGAGAVAGGLIGGLAGLGMTEQNARRYNEALANGGVVLSVRTDDTKSAREAQTLMVEYGGEEVACC
jgi:hypothetical protein